MYKNVVKKVLDILISLFGIILTLIPMIIISIIILITDPGPIFFTQNRVGKNKKIFKLIKFRTMKMNTPHNTPTHLLENPEQYITKIGKILRKTSLDELPQLFNILTLKMSLIGPRPALYNQKDLIKERDKYKANDILPGLTGWAQVNGRDELKITTKAKYDGEYAENISFKFDVKIFFLTIIKVFKKDGIVEGKVSNKMNNQTNKKINKKYKYSVLMSVYKNDSPEFLKLALKSIYEDQIVKPDEIVVVFDGPITKELTTVLNNFKKGKEKIVKYYPQETNKGLGEALRIGSEKCTGDYIFRMDSDDISDPKRFLHQIEYIEKHQEIDVLGTDIAEFNNSLNEKFRYRICPKNHEDIVKMGKKRNPMNHVTVCIKKQALEKSGGYENILLLEDYFLWLKMIVNGCKLANLNEPLVFVRVGNGFNSKRGSKKRIEGWKKIQDYMLQNNLITKKESIKNMIYIKVFVYTPSWLKKIIYSKLLRK